MCKQQTYYPICKEISENTDVGYIIFYNKKFRSTGTPKWKKHLEAPLLCRKTKITIALQLQNLPISIKDVVTIT